jgi:hypothetical protein
MTTAARNEDSYAAYQIQLKKAHSQSTPRVYPTREAAIEKRIASQVFDLSDDATAILCRRCVRPYCDAASKTQGGTSTGFTFAHDPMLILAAKNQGSTGWTSTPCLDVQQRQFFHSQCTAPVLWVMADWAAKLHGEDWQAYPHMEVADLGNAVLLLLCTIAVLLLCYRCTEPALTLY